MSRTISQRRLMALVQSELNQTPLPQQLESLFSSPLSAEEWNALLGIAQSHRMLPVMLEALLRNPGIPVPSQVGGFLQRVSIQHSMAYYQKAAILLDLWKLLRSEQIAAYLVKGPSLNVLYPHEESRSFSDIDLYIPDRAEMARLCHIFDQRGYPKEQDSTSDYHVSYTVSGECARCDVELHYGLSTAWRNGDFDQKLEKIYREAMAAEPPQSVLVMQEELRTLPPTMEALYLLMHMFQHFMNKGFGLRLFADWTVFWNRKGSRVDCKKMAKWLKKLRLGGFVDAVDGICVTYLGMTMPGFGWLEGTPRPQIVEALLDDVFAGGEFGKLDTNRMIVTSRTAGLKGYLFELHRQTKRRFPKCSRCVILLPILWIVTGVIFQCNNLLRRRVTLRDVLASSDARSRLAKKMHIFDES